jgi:hypothetical protein
MQWLHRLGTLALAMALALFAGASAFASAGWSSATMITGIARDTAGSVLADVDIFLVPDPPGSAPAASVRTDGEGRFSVTGLREGAYRLAALKDGYLANWTRVHTAVRSTLDVILRPLPQPGEAGAEKVLESRSWVLRVPRRSVLRDIGQEVLAADASPHGGARSRVIPDALQAELMHRVAVAGFGEAGGGLPLEGAETRMQIASLVGDWANIRLEGMRETYASNDGAGSDRIGARQQRGALAMDVTVESGSHSSVDVTAFYQHANVESVSTAELPSRNAQRSWGYDATWATQLDAASRLAVQLDYVDQTIAFDRPSEGTGNSNRSIGAETAYEVLAGDAHLVRVGLRAQRVDLALPLVRAGDHTNVYLGISGAAGWSAAIDLEDAWSIAGPTTVIYGMAVRQTLDETNATLVVPRAGAAWTGSRLQVRGVVSYHARPGANAPQGPHGGPGGTRLEDPLGLEFRVDAPFGSGWTVAADYFDLPIRETEMGLREGGGSDEYFLTNGNVSDRRARVTLERPGIFGSFSIRFTEGRAEGLVADRMAWGSPFHFLTERELRYRAGAAAIAFPRSGTGLAIEYVEIAERTAGVADAPYVVRDYLDAEFRQDLVRLAFLDARCRLVVSARLAPHARGEDERTEQALVALQERLSAGVAVTF